MDARSNDQVVFLSGQSGETTMSNPSRDPASLNNHRQCFDHTINGPILSDAPLFGSPSTHSTRSNNISITNNNNNDRINRGSRHQRYEPYQRRHTNSSPIKSKPTTKKVSKQHKQAQLFPTLDDLVLPPSPPPTDDDDKLFFQNPVADDDDVFAEFAGFADFSFDDASFDVDSTPSSEEDFALFP
ncbi:hypothetical protein K492DRAFT_178558 [Lichtheimia hyalospora FSU 10163]|nr:hypothetical protein K492DRAFT_178558 [Lichtheimia hyalospora FSU 10163]